MASLVLELQRAAMDTDQDISGLVRKALIVAAKLNLRELREPPEPGNLCELRPSLWTTF